MSNLQAATHGPRVPICLPLEVLVEVFLVVQELEPTEWVRRLIFVSSWWEAVVLGTPMLWRDFDTKVMNPTNALGTHLLHLGIVPLRIELPLVTRPRFFRPTISNHFGRLTTLKIEYANCEDGFDIQTMLSAQSLPLLHRLVLRGRGSEDLQAGSRFPTIDPGLFPQLRVLKLAGWRIPPGSDFTRLQIFDIKDTCLAGWTRHDSPTFMDVLRECWDLQRLRIRDCFLPPDVFSRFSSHPSRIPIIILPRISHLELRVTPGHSAAFFSRIYLPLNINIDLGHDKRARLDTLWNATVTEEFPTLPILASCTDVRVSDKLLTAEHGGGEFSFDFGEFPNPVRSLCALVHLFASSFRTLTHLELTFASPDAVPTKLYRAVLSALPQLTELEVFSPDLFCRPTVKCLLAALGGPGVVCPRLTTLVLFGNFRASRELLNQLRFCLQSRRSRLEVLDLALYHEVGGIAPHGPFPVRDLDEEVERCEREFRSLRAYADEVVYKEFPLVDPE